ncbi:MAG: endonuclease/exonuclease/phosphatase family protein [Polyangia bacterium]
MSSRQRLVRGLAIAYAVALVLVSLSLRFIGEQWWPTTIALYLPRVGYGLPIPLVVGLLLVTAQYRTALASLVFSTLWVAFPLMGLKLGHQETAPANFKLMTWNTFYGRNDNAALFADFQREAPDVFLSQATAHRTKELFRAQPAGYVFESDEEFFMASRFPVVGKLVSPPYADDDRHSGAFVRYTLQTPHGLVDVYNIHPRSPREGVEQARGNGFRSRLSDLGLATESIRAIVKNSALRRRQLDTLLEALRTSKNPYVIAGDTNLPTSSWLYHHVFDELGLKDAFDRVGSGLGYTFPAKRPWMRIDRVLAGDKFEFLRVRNGGGVESDHRYLSTEMSFTP